MPFPSTLGMELEVYATVTRFYIDAEYPNSGPYSLWCRQKFEIKSP